MQDRLRLICGGQVGEGGLGGGYKTNDLPSQFTI